MIETILIHKLYHYQHVLNSSLKKRDILCDLTLILEQPSYITALRELHKKQKNIQLIFVLHICKTKNRIQM